MEKRKKGWIYGNKISIFGSNRSVWKFYNIGILEPI